MLEIKGMKFPLDRKYYTKDEAHIWLKKEGKIIKIGMDEFIAKNAGSISFLNVNKDRVKSGEAIGSFEAAKFVSRFCSPITGEIIAVNDEVLINPQRINDDPYNSWIVKMKPENKAEGYEDIIEGKDEILKWISEEIKKIEFRK